MSTGSEFTLLAVAPSPMLRSIAWLSTAIALACTLFITVDVITTRPQHIRIMNVVWPLTALYGGPIALVAYFWFGRAMKHRANTDHGNMHHPNHPMWQSALLGATHCGAGCMLGDVLTDSGLFLLGASALLGSALVTSYVFDFIAAYLLGIVFQYFAIAPMRHLGFSRGIWAAIKADTLSLIAFQVGMYAWMAIYQKLIFHPRLEPNSPVFWLMMQIGMLAGLATAFPMNWFLVRAGIKEAM